MAEERRTVTKRRTITLPKDELDRWNSLINSSEELGFVELGFVELSAVWIKTVTFDDGFHVDIKVCTGYREDGDLRVEVALLDKHGCEYDCTGGSCVLDGERELLWFDHTAGVEHRYIVEVKGV